MSLKYSDVYAEHLLEQPIKPTYALLTIKELRDILKFAEEKSQERWCGSIFPTESVVVDFHSLDVKGERQLWLKEVF
jgi:hypothetical protein